MSNMAVFRDRNGNPILQGISELEPVRSCVQFTVGAGPAMAIQRKRAFVDGLNQNAAGGKTLLEGDFTPGLVGGRMPNNLQAFLRGLSCRVHLADFSAVISDAQRQIFTEQVRIELKAGQSTYDLGLLAEYDGPDGSPTGLNNAINIRKFGAPWGGDAPIRLDPGVEWSLDFVSTAAISTILTASKDIVVRALMPAALVRQGEQAARTA